MRGVTRGDGTRGEDVTSNVRTIRAVPLRLAGRAAGRRRGAGRGLPAARGLRAHQPRARGPGRAARSRIPATRRRGRCGTSTRARWPGEACRAGSISCVGAAAAPRSDSHAGTLRADAAVGAAGRAALAALRGHRRGGGVLPRVGRRRGGRSRSTPTASSSRSTTSPAARRWARRPSSRAGRVAFKFPAEQATTRLLRIEVNVGRTGAVDAVRRARARAPVGLDHPDGDAAQRTGDGAEGHPARRLSC